MTPMGDRETHMEEWSERHAERLASQCDDPTEAEAWRKAVRQAHEMAIETWRASRRVRPRQTPQRRPHGSHRAGRSRRVATRNRARSPGHLGDDSDPEPDQDVDTRGPRPPVRPCSRSPICEDVRALQIRTSADSRSGKGSE